MDKVTLKDIRLRDYTLDELDRLKVLRGKNIRAKAEICIERAHHITDYYKYHPDTGEPSPLQYARAVNYFLHKKATLFLDENLLAGTTTSKYFGAPVYPEFTGLTIWPELDNIHERLKNPLLLSDADREALNFEIFPFWMDRNILEYTRKKFQNPRSMKLFERIVFFIASKAGCISHTVPCYWRVLEKGTDGIMAEAREEEEQIRKIGRLDEESNSKLIFYQSVQIAMQGIKAYAQNMAAKGRALAQKESDPIRQRDLLHIANICERMPAQQARSFREAINSLWIAQVAVHAENINMAMSPGRLDQILYPFYRHDIEQGVLSVKEALELVGCLWLKLNDNTNLVPETAEELFGGAGTVPAVTIGGVDEQGKDAVNDLTYIMLRVTELLKTRDPSLNARYHYVQNPKIYRNRVAEVIARTKSVPAFHNDVVDIEVLEKHGVQKEHARDYAVIGCVELSSAGRSYDASSSIILNLVAVLELTLYNGRRPVTGDKIISFESGDPAAFESFEEFWEAFTQQLSWMIGQAVKLNNLFGKAYQEILPSPLLSAFFEGPIQSGRDLIFGGSLYNSSGATHIGFADTIDSLNAIEKAVYGDRYCSFADLLAALKVDFKGYKKLHAYLVHKTPKYGTHDLIAIKNSQNVIRFLHECYNDHKNYRGGRYKPAYWTMTNHAGQGKLSGALPNGRKAGHVFASGITPVSQAAARLDVCLKAVGELGSFYIPGGEALNLKFPRIDINDPEDIECFGAAVEAYFRSGGLHVQFNIMSYRMLLEAKKDTTKYPELLVRVSGYSAYFNSLNEAMKDEIITRSEYDLRTGDLDSFPEDMKDLLPFEQENPCSMRGTVATKGYYCVPISRMYRPFWWIESTLNPIHWSTRTEKIWNILLFSAMRARRCIEKLTEVLGSEFTEEMLELLLTGMGLVFRLSHQFRRNIRDFTGRYVFRSMDGSFKVSAEFKNEKMKVRRGEIENPHITIFFKNPHALLNFIFSPKPDILNAMLKQEVVLDGNLNYLYKFAYLANHLRLKGPELL